MQAKDALFQFCYLSRISLLFLSSCFNSNPRISSPILCPFLGPSIWISVPRKGCSASRGAGRAPRLTIQLAKARWGCLFSCAVGRNFLPTVQRPRSKLSKRSTLHPQLHLHLWVYGASPGPRIQPSSWGCSAWRQRHQRSIAWGLGSQGDYLES